MTSPSSRLAKPFRPRAAIPACRSRTRFGSGAPPHRVITPNPLTGSHQALCKPRELEPEASETFANVGCLVRGTPSTSTQASAGNPSTLEMSAPRTTTASIPRRRSRNHVVSDRGRQVPRMIGRLATIATVFATRSATWGSVILAGRSLRAASKRAVSCSPCSRSARRVAGTSAHDRNNELSSTCAGPESKVGLRVPHGSSPLGVFRRSLLPLISPSTLAVCISALEP